MDYILDNIHMGDLLGFTSAIQKRKRSEALLSLAIVHNPFSEDPNALFRELRGREGYSTSGNKLDRGAMDNLKRKLKEKSKFVKVKDGENR
jgi:hypothetical protein